MYMAKGWESKSVEEQLADQQDAMEKSAAASKAQKNAEDIVRQRQINDLKLQHSQILNARTANPHRRASLQAALEHVEGQLAALGITDSLGLTDRG